MQLILSKKYCLKRQQLVNGGNSWSVGGGGRQTKKSHHWESFLWCRVYLGWFVEYVTFLKIFSAPLGLFSNAVANTRNRENVFCLHKQSINLVKLITDAIKQKVVIKYESRHIL